VDHRVVDVLGLDPFRADVLATGGLDDRRSSNGYLGKAEALMADAVGADHAFFSTCGSSLSVKAAMLAIAGNDGELLVSRDAHKSVVAGLIFAGVEPRWIKPRYDEELHLAHPPSPVRSMRHGPCTPTPPVHSSSAPPRTAPARSSQGSSKCAIGAASR
jgi:arginine decarboxylase